ncbi:MAG: DUF2158 domain-containing protein [bacterium]
MENEKFTPGDVVRLKSDQYCAMTLQEIINDVGVCYWFDKDLHIQSQEFKLTSLTKW